MPAARSPRKSPLACLFLRYFPQLHIHISEKSHFQPQEVFIRRLQEASSSGKPHSGSVVTFLCGKHMGCFRPHTVVANRTSCGPAVFLCPAEEHSIREAHHREDYQLSPPGRPVAGAWTEACSSALVCFKQALELVLIWGQETLPG